MAAPVRSSDFIRDIQQHLDRPLLAPDLTWNEAGKFCDARVPPMPVIGSLAEWNSLAEKLRREVLDEVVFRGSLAQQWRDVKTGIVWGESMPGGPGYRLRKVRYEAVPGMWIPAILYEPENLAGKMPVHLAVNGHERQGKGAIYTQIRCINLAKRGIISLNPEWFSFGQLRTAQGELAPTPDRVAADGFKHDAMNQLDLCGVSGLAPFYLAMSRGLDLLLALPAADNERVAVSGLSGGGWQTIIISALDTRVTLCNPVAGYSSLRTWVSVPGMLGDSEQAPNDLGTLADYTHLTAMLAGRSALLTCNAKDKCCFAAAQTPPPLLKAAAPHDGSCAKSCAPIRVRSPRRKSDASAGPAAKRGFGNCASVDPGPCPSSSSPVARPTPPPSLSQTRAGGTSRKKWSEGWPRDGACSPWMSMVSARQRFHAARGGRISPS
ncbi:MAG: hypothetical protein ACREH8_18990 [Opitutaceae bacterium]